MLQNKRLGYLGGVGLLLVVLLGACSPSGPSSVNKPEARVPDPPLPKVLTFSTEHYPPFQFEENGRITGITIDMNEEIFRRMGYQTSTKIYPWIRALEMARYGEVDGVFLAFKTNERETYLDFPQEASFLEEQAFFVRSDSDIRYDGTLESLRNFKIGTIRGYDFGLEFDMAVSSNLIKAESVGTSAENMKKLLNKRIDMFLESVYITDFLVKKDNLGGQLKMLTPPLRQSNLYVAFSKKRELSPRILTEYNRILAEMKQDGTYQEIINKYIR